MAIEQTTSQEEISKYFNEEIKRLEKVLLRTLQFCGEECLRVARQTNSYKDQTGNLRSSLGYVVVQDGNIIKESSPEMVKEGTEGVKQGPDYAHELSHNFPSGVALIVVAGMNYATYVSAMGLDVLDSAELTAERLVPKLLKQLGL